MSQYCVAVSLLAGCERTGLLNPGALIGALIPYSNGWRTATIHSVRIFGHVLAALAAAGAGIAQGQPPCAAVAVQRAYSASLKPTASTHLTLVRQADGSYTAIESADASPYGVVATTPNYQKQFAGCPSGPLNSRGKQAVARLANGGFLFAWLGDPYGPDTYTLTAAVFDAGMNLVSQSQYDGPPSGSTLLLADLNTDGLLDIITVQGVESGGRHGLVHVLLGAGGSTFQGPAVYGIAQSETPYQAVVSDLNGDGKPDLIVVGSFGSPQAEISVFYGNGDGTLQPERILASGSNYMDLAVADLNDDGKQDLVFTARKSLSGSANAGPVVAVELGNGDGTFGVPTEYLVANGDSVAIGDMDGDGNLDIVVSGLTVLFGDGKGSFPRRSDYWQDGSGSIMLTDLDGDGKPDIVVGDGIPSALTGYGFSAMFNRGGGKFSGAPVTSIPGWYGGDFQTHSIAAVDFNGDGVPDVAVQDGSSLAVLTGDGKGGFTTSAPDLLGDGVEVYAITAADFNGDGRPDLAAAVCASAGCQLAVFLGQGDGSFKTATSTASLPASPLGQMAMAAADFNGDGNQDLAVLTNRVVATGEDAVLVFLGDGHGGFSAPISTTVGPQPVSLGVGDFNGDGVPDLVVVDSGVAEGQPSNVRFLFGKGDGTFSTSGPMPNGGSMYIGDQAVVVADLNHDGKLDVAFPTTGGTLMVMLGHGDGTFDQVPGPALPSVEQLSAVDLNGDGILDLVTHGNSPGGSSGAAYLLGNGDGTFEPAVSLAMGNSRGSAIGDFNGDGKPDIVGMANPFGVASFLNVSPVASPLATVSAASYAFSPLAAESLVSAFGASLAGADAPASAVPLSTSLGGTTVSVRDSAGIARVAPLLYVSPGQVNFELPAGMAAGAATVNIFSLISGSMMASSGNVSIAQVAPSLFTANESGTGVAAAEVTLSSGSAQTTSLVFGCSYPPWSCSPVPIDVGGPSDQAVLELYGTGIRGRSSLANVVCEIGSVFAQVLYAGAEKSQFPGLDEVDVALPKSLAGAGIQNVVVTVDGHGSNPVRISFR